MSLETEETEALVPVALEETSLYDETTDLVPVALSVEQGCLSWS